jgi:hypothetical protein
MSQPNEAERPLPDYTIPEATRPPSPYFTGDPATPAGPWTGTAEASKPKRRRRWLWPILAVLLFLAGVGIGSANKGTPAADPLATPQATVTVTPPAVTTTKTVEKAPPACVEALDIASEGFRLAAESLSYSNDATQAAARLDAAGIRKATAGTESVTAKLNVLAPKLATASSACRAAK